MRLLAERFLSQFGEQASREGWTLDLVGDDDFVLFAKPNGPELRAEVGLDLGERYSEISLWPSIGVRHVGVSDLTAQLFGLERGACAVGTTLSTLLGRDGHETYSRWTVSSVDQMPAAVFRIMSDLEAYGEPFFSQYSNLSDLVDAMEQSAKMDFELGHLAVAYAVAGDSLRAQSVLLRIEDWAGEQSPILQEQSIRFVAAFQQRFGVASS